MSDKKSRKSADLEANLARIANAKPRSRSRKDNIYERFITRVENVDSTDNEGNREQVSADGRLAPLKNAEKLSSYEPLSAAELELFASQQDELQQESSLQGIHSRNTDVNLDFSDEEDGGLDRNRSSAAINEDDLSNDPIAREGVSLTNDASYNSKRADIDQDIGDLQSPIKPVPSKETKLLSSKKSLIVGIIVGSLLIAAVVLALIFTGILSTSTPNSEKVNTTNSASAANAGQENTNSQQSSTDASNQSIVEAQTDVPNSDNKDSRNKDAVNENRIDNVKGTSGKSKAETTGETGTEPAITYEVFREESQSTLYRETND